MLVLFSEEKGRKDQRANGHRDANILSSQKLHSTKESSFAQSHTPSLRTAHYLSQWSNINTWAFVPIQDNSALPAQLLRAVWGSTGSPPRPYHGLSFCPSLPPLLHPLLLIPRVWLPHTCPVTFHLRFSFPENNLQHLANWGKQAGLHDSSFFHFKFLPAFISFIRHSFIHSLIPMHIHE